MGHCRSGGFRADSCFELRRHSMFRSLLLGRRRHHIQQPHRMAQRAQEQGPHGQDLVGINNILTFKTLKDVKMYILL